MGPVFAEVALFIRVMMLLRMCIFCFALSVTDAASHIARSASVNLWGGSVVLADVFVVVLSFDYSHDRTVG